MMVTNPNTIGVFEQDIIKAAEILHAKGAMLYMDGANMNALVGIARLRFRRGCNAHQPCTRRSQPHGGGGPAEGRSCEEIVEPFLPIPRLRRAGKKWAFDYKRPKSIDACGHSTAISGARARAGPTSWRMAAPACGTPPWMRC